MYVRYSVQEDFRWVPYSAACVDDPSITTLTPYPVLRLPCQRYRALGPLYK